MLERLIYCLAVSLSNSILVHVAGRLAVGFSHRRADEAAFDGSPRRRRRPPAPRAIIIIMNNAARHLHVLRDPALDGALNMARDEHLLYSEHFRPAAIRIYGWTPPTLSLGRFQKYERIRELPEDIQRLPVVRRSTGGGAILHDREITYCLVVDDSVPLARASTVDLYRAVHECWRTALGSSGTHCDMASDDYPFPSPRTGPFFCFEKPGCTDLIVGSDKLLGSAQRRVVGRVMQHGSLLLGRGFSAHPGADLDEPEPRLVDDWIAYFLEHLAKMLDLVLQAAEWLSEQSTDIERRRQHYADESWTRRR